MLQGSGCKADAHTYASLIDACARSGRADLAIRVYHKALRERCDSSLLIYATAIASCRAAKAVDLSTAMDIYGDMQRCAAAHTNPPQHHLRSVQITDVLRRGVDETGTLPGCSLHSLTLFHFWCRRNLRD